MLTYFPSYYSKTAIATFFVILLILTVIFPSHILPLNILFFSIIGVLIFFTLTHKFSAKYSNVSEKLFIKKVMYTAFILRLVFVIFIYYYNLNHFGMTIGSTADIDFYMKMGHHGADMISQFNIIQLFSDWQKWGIDIADVGYPLYLSFVYLLFGSFSDVMIPLIIKAILGAYTCFILYKIGKRHFGNTVARIAMIFCAFNPIMIWWCGCMMKETEMVFFTVAFINCWDELILEGNRSHTNIALTVFLSLYLFTFRVALGIVAFFAVVLTLMLSMKNIKNKGKIFIVILCFSGFMLAGFYDTMSSIVNQIYDEIIVNDNEAQQVNMDWRSTREGGNEFAKYAGAAIFAPLIFSIPFPTLVYTYQGQEFLMQVAGGNFVKNILSFFVILAVFNLIFKKKWEKHVLPLSFMCGYLVMLVLSIYAQSGRFHMPILPFEMLFAAYGLTLINKKNYHWYNYVLIAETLICIAWSWFKLAGRHLI